MSNSTRNWAAFLGGVNEEVQNIIQRDREEKERAQRMEEQLKYEERRMLMQQEFAKQLDQAKGAAATLAYDDVVSQYGGAVKKTAGFAESLSSLTPGLPVMGGGMSPFPMPRRGQTGTYMEAFDDAWKAIYPSQADIQRRQLEEQKQRGRVELQQTKNQGKTTTKSNKPKSVTLTKKQENTITNNTMDIAYQAVANAPTFTQFKPQLMQFKPVLDTLAGDMLSGVSKKPATFIEFMDAALDRGFPKDNNAIKMLRPLWEGYVRVYAQRKQGK